MSLQLLCQPVLAGEGHETQGVGPRRVALLLDLQPVGEPAEADGLGQAADSPGQLDDSVRPLRVPEGNPRAPGTHRHPNCIWAAEGLGPTLCSGDDMGRYHVLVGGRVRKLTTRERCRLMGFPDTFRFAVPARATVQLGNSVFVPCVAELARQVTTQVFGQVPLTA
jgi:site-specific DNA-cytosine methylase